MLIHIQVGRKDLVLSSAALFFTAPQQGMTKF